MVRVPAATPGSKNKGIRMRVLLIEDDTATAQSIELMLKSEGFNVYTTDLGEEGVDLGKLYDYDIILLDINLPDMSGYEVLKSLRVSKVGTPILILSGLAAIEDKVRGLGFGADDYMTKPFHKDELVARIHAVVRRSKGHAQSVIHTGELLVNLDTKTVEVGGQRVHLTGKEYQMLELLSLRKGTTLTKEMFLNHLYGGMDEPELKIIDVFICKLRKKLAAAAMGKNFIETVKFQQEWGRGYVLRDGAPLNGRRRHGPARKRLIRIRMKISKGAPAGRLFSSSTTIPCIARLHNFSLKRGGGRC
jgi:two-component system, cell cycle response regulator CtrA